MQIFTSDDLNPSEFSLHLIRQAARQYTQARQSGKPLTQALN